MYDHLSVTPWLQGSKVVRNMLIIIDVGIITTSRSTIYSLQIITIIGRI